MKPVWARYLALFLLHLWATSEFWSLYLTMADESISVVCAQRILDGQLPYRDYDTDITPGIYVVSALWYALVGVSSISIRVLMGLISAFTSLFVQACADRVMTGRIRYLPWILWTTAGVMDFPIVNHHWLGGLFVMSSWYFALRWVQDNRPLDRWALGASLGLALWALQSEGFATTLAVVLIWLRLRPPGLLTVFAAAVLGSMLVWAPFLPYFPTVLKMNVFGIGFHVADSYNPYSWQNVVEFMRHYEGLSPAVGWLAFLGASSHIAINLLRYATLPLVTVVALVGAQRRGNRSEQVLALAWLAWVLSCMARMTFLYVSMLSAGWALMLTLVISWMPGRLVLVGMLAMLEGAGFFLRARLRSQLYQYPVPTRAGLYYTLSPGEAQGEAVLASWANRYLPPGTPVLCYPYAAQIYTLYRLKNPIRQLILSPRATDPAVFLQVRDQLKKNKVQWLIYQGVDSEEAAPNYDQTPEQLEAAWAQVRDQLAEGYERVEGDDRLALYRRK